MENIENTLGFHGELMHLLKIFRGSHWLPVFWQIYKYFFRNSWLKILVSSLDNTGKLLVKSLVLREAETSPKKKIYRQRFFRTPQRLLRRICCMFISNVNAILKLKVTLPKLIQAMIESYSNKTWCWNSKGHK